MPSFCRHNRLTTNCPICTREQHIEMRPVVSSSAPKVYEPRERTPGSPERAANTAKPKAARPVREGSRNVKVRRLARGAEDGFYSSLLPGLKSSQDAERLAQELAFATARLAAIAAVPEGVFAQIAGAEDLEERTWLAFLTAYIGPGDGDDPFASIKAAHVSWSSGDPIPTDGIEKGPRGCFDPATAAQTVDAYRAWAQRSGSQQVGLRGEPSWTPERRFERLFERLASKGFTRDGRFELLVLLGRLGVYDLSAGKLQLSGENEATWAAKRAFGIGDLLLLDRRAADFAAACEAPLDALDLALHNWGKGKRTGAGIDPTLPGDEQVLATAIAELGLNKQDEPEEDDFWD